MTNLKYHQQSFKLIHSQPELRGATFPDLPPSVAEWYSLKDGLKLLENYCNEDLPVHPAEFKISWHNEKELAVFLYENQSVFWWAFEKGESDDPPVYINVDPPPDKWVLCCNRFSDFVFTRLFDFFHWHDFDLTTLGFGKPLEKSALKLLNAEYISHPVTYGGISDIQYRFSDQDQKLVIHDHGAKSSWYLSADSPNGVRNLLEKFDDMLEVHFPEIKGG